MQRQTSILAALSFALCFSSVALRAQTFRLSGRVVDSRTQEGIISARIALTSESGKTHTGAISDTNGYFTVPKLSAGTYDIVVSAFGFKSVSFEDKRLWPAPNSDTIELDIAMDPSEEQVSNVVVTATRTANSIENVPVRVEVIGSEDIGEKIMENPRSVVEMLNESVGTRIQQVSAASNTANIRIQGLDGRYTQILVDGIPDHSGLSGSFGITQIMPLNLQRVEIIKGASSALYGPDAIAGIVNFITKDPQQKPEFSAVLNATDQKGYDGSAYYGEMFGDFGLTTLLSYDKQALFDVNGDNFSDLARNTHITFTPKFEYKFSNDLLAKATFTYFNENRLGGVMNAADSDIGKFAPYVESNKTNRLDASGSLAWNGSGGNSASVQAAWTRLKRESYFGPYPFDGLQQFVYADGEYNTILSGNALQAGLAYSSDAFDDQTPDVPASLSYTHNDAGLWLQDELPIVEKWTLLASGRLDDLNQYGLFFTPRAALKFQPATNLDFRIGAGTGFKAPTIFLETAELYGFHNVQPISNLSPEKAQSATLDANYRTALGDAGMHFDLAFFGTQLQNALLVNEDSLTQNRIVIQNATGPTWTTGIEFTALLSMEDISASVSYAYLHTQQTNDGATYELELDPHNWLGLTLSWEDDEDGWSIGAEAYFTSPQRVESDPFRTETPSFWNMGLLIEKAFGPVHLYVNGEDLLDVRPSRFDPVFLGNPEQGTYTPLPVWAPLEGRTINGGLRIVM